jgi:hypothetical protein
MNRYSSSWGIPQPYSPTPNAEAVANQALMRAAFYFGIWLGIAIGNSLVHFLRNQ